MKAISRVIVVMLLCLSAAASAQQPASPAASPRIRQLFDDGWKFKAGEVPNGQSARIDDSTWESVDLPHDFMIEGKGQAIIVPGGRQGGGRGNANLPEKPEGPFDPRSPGGSGNGYLNGGIGWYRKTFTAPANLAGKKTWIQFEGVYMNAEIWINGHELGGRPYGYSTFEIDLTPHLIAGAANTITVRVDVQQPSSRWYSGAGIYRHVWLTTTGVVHLERWGTAITTPEVSERRASVRVSTRVANDTLRPVSAVVETVLFDPTGREMTRSRGGLELPVNGTASASADLTLPQPRRWSVTDPYLYTIESRVRIGDRLVDVERTPFGVRTIEFNSDGTFALNGVPMKMFGVCLHHDLGPLGAAAFDRGIERQLEIMKKMGVNAIRTSHNPPAPALLDLTDRLGFVVMDEAFDEWKQNKTRFGYGQFFDEWAERDIRDMVRRDRNHPSVVMWSIGNEIPEQRNQDAGAALSARLAAYVRDEDPTRPVTAAMNNPTQALATGFAKPLDLFGVNYNLGVYDSVKGSKGYASETSSNYSSRDQYNLVLKDGTAQIVNQLDNHTTSYDLDFPRWGNTAERQFEALAAAPWMAGEFVWTGLDYIGEPTPFNWPNRSSSFGIVDLAGFPKDRFYLYKSKWNPEPVLHILPHWNWPAEFTGKTIPVWAYTNADSVELFLNGKSMGRRDWTGVTVRHLAWDVPYAPGTLRAVARKSGKVIAEDIVETTTAAARLELVADRASLRADGQDLSFVTVRVLDEKGRLCRTCGNQSIAFTLTGGGSIAGVDNGDPTNHEPFIGATKAAATHRAFNGLAIVVIRAPKSGAAMMLSATADGLRAGSVAIKAQ